MRPSGSLIFVIFITDFQPLSVIFGWLWLPVQLLYFKWNSSQLTRNVSHLSQGANANLLVSIFSNYSKSIDNDHPIPVIPPVHSQLKNIYFCDTVLKVLNNLNVIEEVVPDGILTMKNYADSLVNPHRYLFYKFGTYLCF